MRWFVLHGWSALQRFGSDVDTPEKTVRSRWTVALRCSEIAKVELWTPQLRALNLKVLFANIMCWKFALKCQLPHNLGSMVSTMLWWSFSWSVMMVHFSKSCRISQDVISEVSLAPLPNPNEDVSSESRWFILTFLYPNWRSLNPLNIPKRSFWITWMLLQII